MYIYINEYKLLLKRIKNFNLITNMREYVSLYVLLTTNVREAKLQLLYYLHVIFISEKPFKTNSKSI